MCLQKTILGELCTTGITLVGFMPSVDTDMSSNDHFLRIVHHRHHFCRVYLLCGHGHVSSYDHFVKIVHYMYHIYTGFSPVCIRTCFFKLSFPENCAPQVSHLYGLSPYVVTDMFLQMTTY